MRHIMSCHCFSLGGAWRVGGIRLCGAGKTLALLDVMPDPPPHRLTVCSGVMFNAGRFQVAASDTSGHPV